MKFTLSWLKEYLETDSSIEQICEVLTSIGLEVEEVENFAEILSPFTVAKILEAEKHHDADKLKVCKVDVGENEPLQIVCGAPNARAGIKIPFAKIGSVIPTNGMQIKKSSIRGVESNGMLCSAAELGIAEDAEGIFELPEDAKVGEEFAKYAGFDDCLIEIAITPNRGDCLGVYGIARDLAAAGLGKLKDLQIPDYQKNLGTSEISVSIDKKAEDKCNWFVGVYFAGLENKQSPEWLQRKLTSIDKKPISALVDITNYLTFSFGRPAHIYDADKLDGSLEVRASKKGEKITSLDEKEYDLDNDTLIIVDSKKPQAIAGIIGGLESGVTENTENAFLEIAHFHPDEVSKNGRKLQIDSDARYRFERTVDYKSHDFYRLAVSLILDICGGEASEPNFAGNLDFNETEISFEYSKISKRIGIEIDSNEIDRILADLKFEKISGDASSATFKVPSFRPDVTIVEDLSEEIARIVGYDNIPIKTIEKPQQNKEVISPNQKRVNKAKIILSNQGLDEVVSFSFMKEAIAEAYLPKDSKLIEVANPISLDLNVMRPSLIPNLVDAIQKNKVRGNDNLRFFEVGNIFHNSNNKFTQNQNIAGVRVGNIREKTATENAEQADLYEIKADMNSILELNFDTSKLQISDNENYKYYHPSRSAIVRLGKNIIAVFGELHPSTCKLHSLKQRVYGFEIFMDNLPSEKSKNSYTKKPFNVSNLQPVDRDFAFIVGEKTPVNDIINAVRKAEKNILEEVSIFDIYSGKNIGEGKKSVAFKITLQPTKETLTDENIENISNSIIKSVENAVDGVLRDAN